MQVTIYYKQNTGITTPQGESCDYFIINKLGVDLANRRGFAEVYYYERKEHAQATTAANASRLIEWDISKEQSVADAITTLLSFKEVDTTAGDKVTFTNSTPL